MGGNFKARILPNMLVVVFLTILFGEYNGSRIGVIETLEREAYAWRMQREAAVKSNSIVIVDIDRDTLRAHGNWPFNRGLFAELNKQLFDNYQVRIAAYALPFSRPDNTALLVLDEITEKLGGGFFDARGATQEMRDTYNYDDRMTESLRNNPVVLGYVFDETGRVEGSLPRPIVLNDDKGKRITDSRLKILTRPWSFYTGSTGNLRGYLLAASNAAGHLNVNVDNDGVVRHIPAFVSYAGGLHPSLPLAVYQRLRREKSFTAALDSDGWFGRTIIKRVQVGNRTIPMNETGRIYINYLGKGGRNVNFDAAVQSPFRYVSFTEVLSGKVPNSYLRDKIVFIGSSSEQLRHAYPTPLNPSLPGVEVFATQLANLIGENMLQRDRGIMESELLLLLAVGLVLAVGLTLTNPPVALLLLAATIYLFIQFILSRWETHYEVWAVTPMIATLTGLFITNTLSGLLAEWQANRKLQTTFGQYVPPEFAKKIGTSGKNIKLEGEERELSVLFSDVRDFTSISETLTPQELTLLMNRMLTDLSEVIHRHHGTVDKYIGDAIMAFWNAPLEDEKHAERAVLAAMDMQKAMDALARDLAKKGFDRPLKLGVGICTGNANVGNMGSTLRMTYTAIGDTVNLASRTEGLTKFYRCPVLITDTTRRQCRGIACREVDLVRVKGRQKPALLYEPLDRRELIDPEMIALVKQFEKMRHLYEKGEFAAAKAELDSYRSAMPDDGLATLYEERLAVLLKSPPSAWDGVMTHETK